VDAIVCIGVLIKGETMHFVFISDAVAKGMMNIGLQTSTPVILGVLTCFNEKQVVARRSGSHSHGRDWGKTAVEMALLHIESMGGGAKSPIRRHWRNWDSERLRGFGAALEKAKNKKKKTPGFFKTAGNNHARRQLCDSAMGFIYGNRLRY
jgi:hypothetical protein